MVKVAGLPHMHQRGTQCSLIPLQGMCMNGMKDHGMSWRALFCMCIFMSHTATNCSNFSRCLGDLGKSGKFQREMTHEKSSWESAYRSFSLARFCHLFLLELLAVFHSSCAMKWTDKLEAVLMQLWWTSERSSTLQVFGRYRESHFAEFLQDEMQPSNAFVSILPGTS